MDFFELCCLVDLGQRKVLSGDSRVRGSDACLFTNSLSAGLLLSTQFLYPRVS